MKMKKRRILSMLLALIMIFNSIPMPHINAYADTLGEAVCDCGYEEYVQTGVGKTSPNDAYMNGHTLECAIYNVEPVEPICECEGEHVVGCEYYVAPTCAECGAEGDTHKNTCSFYDCPNCDDENCDGTCFDSGSVDTESNNAEKSCTCNAAEGEPHKTDCDLFVASCQCNNLDGTHAATCPLYVESSCNCGASDGSAHGTDCPLYVEPETSIDIPDYSGDIGKYARFNENISSDEWFVVLDNTPSVPVDYSLGYTVEYFSSDVVFEIIDYVVLNDIFDLTDEETHEVIGTKTETTLWYQVNVIDGTAPEGFENGYWILQNYLNEEDAYDYDVLILTVDIEDEDVTVSNSIVINGVEIVTEGNMPTGTVLSAAEYIIEEPSVFGLTDNSNVVASYDIKLLDEEGNPIQPGEVVFVTMDAEAMKLDDGDIVELIHQHGTAIERTTHVVIGGKLVFPVAGFSVFIVNSTTDKTGIEIVGNSKDNPYVMTVGETKIFFDNYGGGIPPYIKVKSNVSQLYEYRNLIKYYYMDDGKPKEITITRTGSWWNYRYTIFVDNESIDGMQDMSGNTTPSGIYQENQGSTTYRGEWQVTDESMAISYEITSVNYQGRKHMAPYITVTAQDAGLVTLTYKYDENESETLYIRVVAPDARLYVDDQVAERGCLVPVGLGDADGVTYSWSRSDGQVIRSEALNADGTINVSLDRGGLTGSRSPITYEVTATMTDGTTQSASYEVLYCNEILNGSFETPDLSKLEGAAENYYLFNGYPGLYWKTTAPGTDGKLTQDIEMILAGDASRYSYGVGNAYNDGGKQFVELNAEAFGALYQDILTTPGATLSWSFSHNGRTTRGSNNEMYVIVAATKDVSSIINEDDIDDLLDTLVETEPNKSNINGKKLTYGGGDYYVWYHSADSSASSWEQISGSYTVPEGQYLTRLFFASETNNNLTDKTLGNLIDAVSAGETMNYKIEYYIDGSIENTKTQTSSATVYTSVELKHLQKYLVDGYVLTAAKIQLKSSAVDYPGDVANGLYITSYGDSGDKDHAIILKVYLSKHAVTITKKIVIEGWASMTDSERSALIGNGLTARFDLTSSNNTYNAKLTIIAVSSTGELIAMGEFVDGSGKAPVNGTYDVTETSAPTIPGYSCSTAFDKTQITISDSKPTEAIVCTNTYKKVIGTLEIEKTVALEYARDIVPNDTFIFTISSNVLANGTYSVSIDGTESTIEASDGNMSVSLSGFDTDSDKMKSIIISNIPAGSYTVTENIDADYTTQGPNDNITVPAGGTGKASFINTYKRHLRKLTIHKTVKNAPSGETPEFLFHVKDNNENKIADIIVKCDSSGKGSVTLYDLPLGTYTVTEDTSWNWRYKAEGSAEEQSTLSVGVDGEVSFINKFSSNKWLNFSSVLRNMFDKNV